MSENSQMESHGHFLFHLLVMGLAVKANHKAEPTDHVYKVWSEQAMLLR